MGHPEKSPSAPQHRRTQHQWRHGQGGALLGMGRTAPLRINDPCTKSETLTAVSSAPNARHKQFWRRTRIPVSGLTGRNKSGQARIRFNTRKDRQDHRCAVRQTRGRNSPAPTFRLRMQARSNRSATCRPIRQEPRPLAPKHQKQRSQTVSTHI